MRVRRASLIFPVNIPRFVEKVWTRNADVLTADLEDAVPPAEKATARALVKDAIPIIAKGGAEVSIRINKEMWEEDIKACVWPGLTSITFPKVETAEEMRKADELITRLERERNIPEGSVELHPLIESAKGVKNAYEIATASPRIKSFGGVSPGDTSISLGVRAGCKDMDLLGYANAETQWVAGALGLGQGGPFLRGLSFFDYSTPEDIFLEILAVARKLGYRGGGGIHPAQVKAFLKGYTPTEEEMEEAKAIVAAFKKAFAEGKVCVEFRGRMIDSYLVQQDQELLDWGAACAERDTEKARAVKNASMKDGKE